MSEMNDLPRKPRRRWIPIVIGIVFVIFVLGVGAVIFTVAWFRQQLQITETTATNAAQEFEADPREILPGSARCWKCAMANPRTSPSGKKSRAPTFRSRRCI